MNELIEVKEKMALEAFSSDEGLESIIEKARILVSNFKPDVTTVKGRAEITSLASKVARFKNKLDGLGKDLVSGWKAKSKAVDQNRKKVRDELDALKVVARKPLTDWEEKEEARIAEEEEIETVRKKAHEDNIETLNEYRRVGSGAESSVYIELLEKVEAFKIDDSLDEFEDQAQLVKDQAITYLKGYIEERQEYERSQAEIQRFKDENEAREEKETADRKIREADKQAERDKQQREDQEEVARVQALNNKMLVFTNYKSNPIHTTTVEQWEEALAAIQAIEMSVENWEDFLPAAMEQQKDTIVGLENIIAQRKQYDTDQAELEQRRKDAEELQRQQEATQAKADAKKKREENEARRNKIHARISNAIAEMQSDQTPQELTMEIADGNIPHLKIEY